MPHISGAPSQGTSKPKGGLALADTRKLTPDTDTIDDRKAEGRESEDSNISITREKSKPKILAQVSSETSIGDDSSGKEKKTTKASSQSSADASQDIAKAAKEKKASRTGSQMSYEARKDSSRGSVPDMDYYTGGHVIYPSGKRTSGTNMAREKKMSKPSSQVSSQAAAAAVYSPGSEGRLKSAGSSRRVSTERTSRPYEEAVKLQEDDIQTQVAFDAIRSKGKLDAEQSAFDVFHFQNEAERLRYEAERRSQIEAEQKKKKAKQKEPYGSFQIIMVSDDEAEVPEEEPELVELSARREKKAQERAEKQRKAEGRAWVEGKDKDSISQGSQDSQKSGKGQVYQSLASPRASLGAVKPRPSSAYRSERQDLPDSSRSIVHGPDRDMYTGGHVIYPSWRSYQSGQPSQTEASQVGFERRDQAGSGPQDGFAFKPVTTIIPNLKGERCVRHYISPTVQGKEIGIQKTGNVGVAQTSPETSQLRVGPSLYDMGTQMHGNTICVQTGDSMRNLGMPPIQYSGNQICIQTGESMRNLGTQPMQSSSTGLQGQKMPNAQARSHGMEQTTSYHDPETRGMVMRGPGNQSMQPTGMEMGGPRELIGHARPLSSGQGQKTSYYHAPETQGVAIQTGFIPGTTNYLPNLKGQKCETLYDIRPRDPSTQSIACQMTGNEFATQTSPGVSAYVLGPSMYDFGTQMHGHQIAIQTGSSMRDMGLGGYPCQGAGSHTLSLFTPPDSMTDFDYKQAAPVEVTSDPVAHSARAMLTPSQRSLDESRVNLDTSEKMESRSLPSSSKSKSLPPSSTSTHGIEEVEYEEIIEEDEPVYETRTIVKEIEIEEKEETVKKNRRLSFLPNFSTPQAGLSMFGQKNKRLSYFPTDKSQEAAETKSVLEKISHTEIRSSSPTARNEFVIDEYDPMQEVEPLTQKGLQKAKRPTPKPQRKPSVEEQQEKGRRGSSAASRKSSKSRRSSLQSPKSQTSAISSSRQPSPNLSNNNCKAQSILPVIDARNMNNCHKISVNEEKLPGLPRKSSRRPTLAVLKEETN